ncbi:hypothetical protein MXD63_33305, partial [Frankia sp. Cpl3]|nr:hypothetical protein [Frankia sp. Cpl3]
MPLRLSTAVRQDRRSCFRCGGDSLALGRRRGLSDVLGELSLRFQDFNGEVDQATLRVQGLAGEVEDLIDGLTWLKLVRSSPRPVDLVEGVGEVVG